MKVGDKLYCYVDFIYDASSDEKLFISGNFYSISYIFDELIYIDAYNGRSYLFIDEEAKKYFMTLCEYRKLKLITLQQNENI